MIKNKKIAFISLGCDKNLTDSEVMIGLLAEKGAAFTDDEEDADAVIINTCGFIKEAMEESTETLERVLALKNKGKDVKVIAAGCLTERRRDKMLIKYPTLDAAVGVNNYIKIVEALEYVFDGGRADLTGNGKTDEDAATKRVLSTPGHYAYMKIAEGCDNCCTYCTIPSIRGKYRSRPLERLVEEGWLLSERGVKEIILVAQDTALYGTDLYGEKKLPELLKKLAQIDEIEWIRILYCYPEHINDEIIDEIAANSKVCKYIDIPIQHCDDEILSKMGRKGDNAKLSALIKKLRFKVPNIELRTTLMVGFPGETTEQFQTLLNFAAEVKFNKLGVFAYSKEKGTAAAAMQGHLTADAKKRRRNRLMVQQQKISREYLKGKIGKTIKVLISGGVPFEKNYYFGRSQYDCPEVDGLVYVKSADPLTIGNFYDVVIEDSDEYDLIGAVNFELA